MWSSGSHILGKDAIRYGNQHIFNSFQRRRPHAAYILTRAQLESPDPVIYIPFNFAPDAQLRARMSGTKGGGEVRETDYEASLNVDGVPRIGFTRSLGGHVCGGR
jgi:hypothetical protein